MKAYIMINIRTGEITEVVRHLRKVQQVTEAHMTFGPYDAVAIVDTPDVNTLGQMLATAIQPIPGVQTTLTCIAVED